MDVSKKTMETTKKPASVLFEWTLERYNHKNGSRSKRNVKMREHW